MGLKRQFGFDFFFLSWLFQRLNEKFQLEGEHGQIWEIFECPLIYDYVQTDMKSATQVHMPKRRKKIFQKNLFLFKIEKMVLPKFTGKAFVSF